MSGRLPAPTVRRMARVGGLTLLIAALALGGCAAAPRSAPPDLAVAPTRDAWGPHPGSEMEWWYVAATSPEAGLSFHAAFFRAPVPPHRVGPYRALRCLFRDTYTVATVAITDLRTGRRAVHEATGFPFACPPPCGDEPRIRLPGWALEQDGPGRPVTLRTPDLALTLAPLKPRTVHPPGWWGEPGMGHLAYQSVTRLSYRGTWRGRDVAGSAWMDHQWGDLVPGPDARWSWHGVHLSDGSDLMLLDLTRPDGSARVLGGSLTDAAGVTRALVALEAAPTQVWAGAWGRCYPVGWDVRAHGLALTIRPLRTRQEVVSISGVVYWEGPVAVQGSVDGHRVTGVGLGEHFPLPR